jgi:hypothetical protein
VGEDDDILDLLEKAEGLGSEQLDDDASIEKTRFALGVIPHDTSTDRTRWVSIGRILHRTYGQDGLPLFVEWSHGGDYEPSDGDEEILRVWKSFDTDLLRDAG